MYSDSSVLLVIIIHLDNENLVQASSMADDVYLRYERR